MVVMQLDEFLVHICVTLECPQGQKEVSGDRTVGFCQVCEIHRGYRGHPEHKIKGGRGKGLQGSGI